MNKIPSQLKKRLLATLRGGKEYAHPGEEVAIDLVLSHISEKDIKILDIGCGLGGTVDYISEKLPHAEIIAIDNDHSVIEHAIANYGKKIKFHEMDVMNVDTLEAKQFDIVILMNSFFFFPNQKEALKKIHHVSKPNGKLICFEYVDFSTDGSGFLQGDDEESIFNAIQYSTIKDLLKNSGWSLEQCHDLTENYEKWYTELCEKIQSMQQELISKFKIDTYEWANKIYNDLLKSIKQRKIGGCILTATAISS